MARKERRKGIRKGELTQGEDFKQGSLFVTSFGEYVIGYPLEKNKLRREGN